MFFSFSDSSSNEEYPGWPLRNYLAFITHKFKLSYCSVLAIRLREKSVKNSLLFDLKLESSAVPDIQSIECVGWEKNSNNKLLPRTVDLSAVLDPSRLAENAVGLNLKLMRWRLVPSLDLETITATRCLILGSGTLGCYVSRGLMVTIVTIIKVNYKWMSFQLKAWGVTNITFVDNSQVSYSNPVRQPLFKFEDCINGGKEKALAAADALKQIYPNVNSKGIQLSIPMPGHRVPDHCMTWLQTIISLIKCFSQLSDRKGWERRPNSEPIDWWKRCYISIDGHSGESMASHCSLGRKE